MTSARDSTVVVVLGSGRSGSTLLERLLINHEGFVSTGELRNFFSRALHPGETCGCGVSHRECPMWSRVVEAAFGGFDTAAFAAMVETTLRFNRTRSIPRFALRGGTRRRLDAYSAGLWRTYEALASVADAQVVIDASKLGAHGLLVRRGAGARKLVWLHLVRDPRAVAFSWTRARKRLGGEATGMMRTHNPFGTGVRWVRENLLSEFIARGARTSARVRYEDLAGDPDGTVARLLAGLQLAADRRAEPPVDHGAQGNPAVRGKPLGRIELDDEWRTALAGRDRVAVTAVTWPLRLRYGYRGRRE